MPNIQQWIPLGDQQGCHRATMDPQIKLFGQTIGVISTHTGASADAGVQPTCASPPWDTAPSSSQDGGGSMVLQAEDEGVVEKRVSAKSNSRDDFLQPPTFRKSIPEYGAPNNVGALVRDESEGAQSDELKDFGEGDRNSSLDDKNIQKSVKVVACPRCDSLDTKFCYYNNYNVNQPRHFCKKCQRYWTAGGTLRNVPVGAGRRKNKHGGLQRDGPEGSLTSAIQGDSTDSPSHLLSCGVSSPTSQKASSSNLSQPKRLTGQNSPLRSPGSSLSFGQDSGITLASPYSLHQGGRLPFQSFSGSQGFVTSGTEASVVGSSDSASTLGQRLVQFSSGNGFENDYSRSSPIGTKQDAGGLLSVQIPLTTTMLQQLESSGVYRSIVSSDTCPWAGNGASVGFFNGEWPHGYHLEWDGKHPVLSTQTPPYSTPVTRGVGAGAIPSPSSSWGPAPWGPWATTVGHSTQITPSGGQGMGAGLPSPGQPVVIQQTYGKRAVPEGGRSEVAACPAKVMRADDPKENFRSMWPMLGKSHSEVNTAGGTLKLFHPKVEVSGACEQKDSFIYRHFAAGTAARPVPFQVTI